MDLKKIREENGLTQIDMAKRVGVSIITYRNWEYGGTKPNEDNAAALGKVIKEIEQRGPDNGRRKLD